MWEAFQSDPERLGAFLIYCVIALMVLGIVAIAAWRKNEAGKREAELKMEMVARGWSADDILRVLAAKVTDDAKLAETISHKKK